MKAAEGSGTAVSDELAAAFGTSINVGREY